MGLATASMEQAEVDHLLAQLDPYQNNCITYSDVVQLLSSYMVPAWGYDQSQQ
jgi:hypothetical protein